MKFDQLLIDLVFVFISVDLPPQSMLTATHELIAKAIDDGYLTANYTLVGHRQTRDTECPGDRLFNEIGQWPNFDPNVIPADDPK